MHMVNANEGWLNAFAVDRGWGEPAMTTSEVFVSAEVGAIPSTPRDSVLAVFLLAISVALFTRILS